MQPEGGRVKERGWRIYAVVGSCTSVYFLNQFTLLSFFNFRSKHDITEQAIITEQQL